MGIGFAFGVVVGIVFGVLLALGLVFFGIFGLVLVLGLVGVDWLGWFGSR